MGVKKIILIDDEPDFVNNVKAYFEMHNYECFTATNGQEGLAKIEKEQPMLIILDILMPNMDGYTMLRELKKRKIDMKCIVITAKEKLKDLFELEKVDRFLTKPFELSKLKDIVDELLKNVDIVNEQAASATKPAEAKGKTVLIIEDEIKLAESIRRYLEIKGYKTQAVFAGEEGLAAVAAHKPDLILTDIMMPGMDGYSMIKELRKANRETPIIVMTGKERMKELIAMEGISDLVPKPFDLEVLEQKISNVINNS